MTFMTFMYLYVFSLHCYTVRIMPIVIVSANDADTLYPAPHCGQNVAGETGIYAVHPLRHRSLFY